MSGVANEGGAAHPQAAKKLEKAVEDFEKAPRTTGHHPFECREFEDLLPGPGGGVEGGTEKVEVT